jgi:DUF4097 and DUF4098 domain-containing protein YvlB
MLARNSENMSHDMKKNPNAKRALVLALAYALALGAASASHAADEEEIDQKVAASPRGVVRISNVAGVVNVIGWDRSEVEVRGRHWGSVDRVDVFSDNGRVSVKAVHRNGSRGGADLDIHVPEGSDLDITTTSADVETARLTGPQRVKTVSGAIRADFAKDFEGKTVSGDMRLRGDAKSGGDIHVETISGDIILERASGELDAESTSGDLFLDIREGTMVRMRTTSGDISLRGSLRKEATVFAETVSGDVTLRVKPGAGLDYEAITFSGDLGNCFGKQSERTNRHGPGKRLLGTTGEGQARLRVKSMSGDIALCDR